MGNEIIYDDCLNKRIEDIIKTAVENKIRNYESLVRNTDSSLYDYIMEKSSKMDKFNPLFKNRLKFVLDKMQDIPLCPICGKEVDIGHCKTSRNFVKYCSKSCRDSDPKSRTLDKEKYFIKTGYTHPMKNPEVTGEMKRNYKNKTGYEYSFQNPEVKEKIENENVKKYGVKHPSKLKSISAKTKITTRRNKYDKMMEDGKIRPLFTFEEFLKFNRENDTLKWKCLLCGNEFDAKIEHGKSKISGTYAVCPKCFVYEGRSKEEYILANFIEKVCPYEVLRNKMILKDKENYKKSKEIDIYIPELKLGFEYDGLYYHQKDRVGERYHMKKTIMAENQGIRLVHIRSNELKKYPEWWAYTIIKMVNGKYNILDEVKEKSDTIYFERSLINKCWEVPGYELVHESNPIERVLALDETHIYRYEDCGFLVYKKIKV